MQASKRLWVLARKEVQIQGELLLLNKSLANKDHRSTMILSFMQEALHRTMREWVPLRCLGTSLSKNSPARRAWSCICLQMIMELLASQGCVLVSRLRRMTSETSMSLKSLLMINGPTCEDLFLMSLLTG